jgi:formimidoylglutamate deiminase
VNRPGLYARHALMPDGWREDVTLALDDAGLIAEIVPGREAGAIELPGPVMPGMVNVHSHIHQRLIAGLTGRRGGGPDSFWSWRERMYQAVEQLDGDGFADLAAHAFMELLEGGYTSVGEFHYPHRLDGQAPLTTARQVLSAAGRAGCGLTLLPVWYRYGGFERQPLAERQRAFALSLDELVDLVATLRDSIDRNLQKVGVAPHSLRAVDARDMPELVERIGPGPFHLHISEQPAEVAACLEHHGCRPVAWLLRHLAPDARWCFIHATHADESEWRALAKAGSVVGLCPTTEADLGDGLFPAAEFRAAGGRIAIGSDSNVVTRAAEELRLLEWGQRLRLNARNVLCDDDEPIGRALWSESARAGAEALRQPVGELAVGRRADLLVLDAAHPMLAGLSCDEQLDTFVTANEPGMIDEVWVAGRARVRGGRHVDRDGLEARVAELRQRLAGAVAS